MVKGKDAGSAREAQRRVGRVDQLTRVFEHRGAGGPDAEHERADRHAGQDEPSVAVRADLWTLEVAGQPEGEIAAPEHFGVRQGTYKYIRDGKNRRDLLYDLQTDPQERTNIATQQAEITAQLRRRVAEWKSYMAQYTKERVAK